MDLLDYQAGCQQIVSNLIQLGINFLAIDFDDTFVNCHTGGNWTGTTEALSQKVRPLFRSLVPIALDHHIQVAIVTFSRQFPIIQCVLREVFPCHYLNIPLREGNGKDSLLWTYQGLGSMKGKQRHLASAAEELNHRLHSIHQLDPDLLEKQLERQHLFISAQQQYQLRQQQELELDQSFEMDFALPSSLPTSSSPPSSLPPSSPPHSTLSLSSSSSTTPPSSSYPPPQLPPLPSPTSHLPSYFITRASTLLVDDDLSNVKLALDEGVRAICFDPAQPNMLISEVRLLKEAVLGPHRGTEREREGVHMEGEIEGGEH